MCDIYYYVLEHKETEAVAISHWLHRSFFVSFVEKIRLVDDVEGSIHLHIYMYLLHM